MVRDLREGTNLFQDLWNSDIHKIAVENPIMHKYAKKRIKNYKHYDQKIQPWQFGNDPAGQDNDSKATCLWLKNLPILKPTGTLDGSTARNDIHNCPPSPDRWKIRSTFFPGIAKAMAEQWGEQTLRTKKGSVNAPFFIIVNYCHDIYDGLKAFVYKGFRIISFLSLLS